jgi:DNA polymerase theta
VKEDLERARQGFCMATDLHLTFLVTPVQEELPLNWQL